MTKLKKILLFIFLLTIVGLLSAILLRDYFLERKINSVCESFHNKTGGMLIISEKKFESLQSIRFGEILILSPANDSIIKVDSATVGSSLWKLIQFKSPINRIEIKNVDVALYKDSIKSNYDFLFRKKITQLEETEKPRIEKNYAAELSSIWDNMMDLSSLKIFVNDIKVKFNNT